MTDKPSSASSIPDFQQLFEEEERVRLAKVSAKKKQQRITHRNNVYAKRKRKQAMSAGKTPQELLAEMMQANNAKDEKETQLLAAKQKESQEAKQKAQDDLLARQDDLLARQDDLVAQQDKLLARQDKLDNKRDADDAAFAARVDTNKKRREESFKTLAAMFVKLESDKPVPDPLGTPTALQAFTPSSTALARRLPKTLSKTPSSLLSKGHSIMSPVDEKVEKTPKNQGTAELELAARLEVLTPTFDAPDWKIPGVSLVLYTATKSDIMKGAKPLKIKEGLLAVHGSCQVRDCTVVLSSGTLGGYPSKKPSMLSRLVGSSNKAAEGIAIEDIDNVKRIFAGDDVLVAFVGDSAHWYRYKGTCAFEKQAVISMPHVIHLAIKDGQVAILEERMGNTRKGTSLQVRRLPLDSIQALKNDEASTAGTVIMYDANNRVGGKIFLTKGNTFLCLEDAKTNKKLFHVPDEGVIKSRTKWGFNNSEIVQAIATDGCLFACHKEKGLQYFSSKWFEVGLSEQRVKLAGGGNVVLVSTGTKVGYLVHEEEDSGGDGTVDIHESEDWWDFGALGATKIVKMGVSDEAVHVLVAVHDKNADREIAANDVDKETEEEEEGETAATDDEDEADEKMGATALFQD